MSIIQSGLEFLLDSSHSCYPSLLQNLQNSEIFNIFDDKVCLNILFSKIVGIGIAVLASLIKVPQIIKFILNKSTLGFSIASFTIDIGLNFISLGYSLMIDSPISLYREKVVFIYQNAIILLLMFLYKQDTKNYYLKLNLLLIFSVLGNILVYYKVIPYDVIAFFYTVSPILQLYSRYLQIKLIYKNKSTGHLSFLTYFVNWCGVLARAYTIFIEQPEDLLSLFQYSLSFSSQAIVVFQFIYYWKSTNQSNQKQKNQKKET